MKKQSMTVAILIAFLAVAGISLVAVGRRGSRLESQGPRGKTQSIQLTRESIAGLTWDDLAAGRFVVQGQSSSKFDELLAWTEQTSNPPTVYLRGLLLLTNGRPDEALESFDKVPIDVIPAEQLYAPYRLHDERRPALENVYFSKLLAKLEQGDLSPLISARILARANRLEESLRAYLATDPGDWTHYDAQCLKRIALHSGLESEVRRIVMGAIGGGRLHQANHDAFLEIAFQQADKRQVAVLRQHFRDHLEQNPKATSAVVSSLKKLRGDRELFLKKEYRELLDAHQHANPLQVTSESALMLFLSALSEGDRELAKLWGQELRRRHPNPETTRWVHELTASKFDGA